MKFRKLENLLVAAALASASQLASATPSDPLKVAVIVSIDPDEINVPTIELFRAVSDSARDARGMTQSSAQDVKQQLRPTAGLTNLGAIPAFDRKSFVKVGVGKAVKLSAKKSRKRVIPQVQAMLDTLALDGAVIVDCAPAGTKVVKRCGLYYYDRSLGRVLAATSKSFKVGVADASRWAPGLLAGLSQGLSAYASNLERDKLKQVIAESNEETDSGQVAVEVKLVGETLAEPHRQVKALPGAALWLGNVGKGYTSGLELSYAKASATGDEEEVTLVERSVGLNFAVQSHALETMIWELGLGVHYAVLNAESQGLERTDDQTDGKLEAKMIKLRFAPGVLWQLSKNLQFGTGLAYDRMVPFTESATGSYHGQNFARNSLGFGIRLRTVF